MTDELLRFRQEFPILAKTVYMISNSLGAMPRGVFDRMHDYADTWAERGVRAWGEGWWDMPVRTGDLVARLMGAPPGTVSMHQNATIAATIVLSCLDFPPERNKLVMTGMDFPSVIYAHRQFAQGADVVVIPSHDDITIDTDELLAAIDERTRLVSISHVLFKSAYIMDVAAIVARAHAVGALVALDGFHAVGTIPVDVTALDADFYFGGCLKWLCGGPGGAFLYVKPALARTLQPRFTGWQAHPRSFGFETGEMEYRDDAWRFLNGTPHVPCLYAVQPGLELIYQAGIDAIRAKSMRQTARLLALAGERGWPVTAVADPARRGGTVALNVPHAYEVSRELLTREFLVDYRVGAGIRVSPHFYSTDDELEATAREIASILDTRAYERHMGGKAFVT
jgi:kynureninase